MEDPLVHRLAQSGNIANLRACLQQGELNVEEVDHYGWTAVLAAADVGHAKVVDLLLAHARDPNHLANAAAPDGVTPLMYSAREGHEEVVTVLLEHGAQPDL